MAHLSWKHNVIELVEREKMESGSKESNLWTWTKYIFMASEGEIMFGFSCDSGILNNFITSHRTNGVYTRRKKGSIFLSTEKKLYNLSPFCRLSLAELITAQIFYEAWQPACLKLWNLRKHVALSMKINSQRL